MGLLQKRKTRLQTRLKIVLSRLTPDGGGGVLNKCLYGEAPPRGQALTLLYTIFHEKVPLSAFVYLLLTNGTRFTYLV